MKYLVVRKAQETQTHRENPFTEPASAGSEPMTFGESRDISDFEARELASDPNYEWVVPSMPLTLLEPVATPSSANPENPSPWGVEAVGALSSQQDGSGVCVAVLDTGIRGDHTAFEKAKSRWTLRDFSEDARGVAGSAKDIHGHGTHVAGTLFGGWVGGKRIGVAPGVRRVLIGKVLGPHGATTESLYNAIQWAVSEKADIISMSLGIDYSKLVEMLLENDYPARIASSIALQSYRENVRLFDSLAASVRARTMMAGGALLVAASGNESLRETDRRFTVETVPPGAGDGFVSIGAIQRGPQPSTFAVASFSNTGCALCAPGVAVLSAAHDGDSEHLVSMNGTSMAAPHAAGVFALWVQKLFPDGKRPKEWASDVIREVERNARALQGQLRSDVGLGLVQAPPIDP